MALSSSPRKVVPLSSGDDWPPSNKSKALPSITKRAFFCGVVVESPGAGKQYSDDVQDLVASLGDSIDSNGTLPSRPETPGVDRSDTEGPHTRKRAMTDSSALSDQLKEFIETERSYVKRLGILKQDYADPLRSFARSKETAILPAYEAKILFGNIDNLLPVNEAFLADLEKMIAPNGSKTVGGIGDVSLKHFKVLRGFEHYKQYYSKREEAQAIFEREMAKRSSSFAAYIDRIKYSNADVRNRVGLRELLMDPVQRVPRYTLMFRNMIKRMAADDPQRAKLVEADEIASKIALAETDEQTKRAQVMYCLSAAIDDFPPALISHARRFVDCIDVEDVFSDGFGSGNQNTLVESLHCSLLLFDDKLLIVKRPGHGEKGARALSGLDDLEKLNKSGGRPTMKKSGMSSKGVVEVTDVVATDVGGADFHLYLENPPQDQTERWSGRPFRTMAVVHPPSGPNMNPSQTEADKRRFLENLWTTQAKYRTKSGQSVVLCAEEREVESRGSRTTFARTYFNIYSRTAFLREPKKTKVVVHIDPFGSADVIPCSLSAPPFVVIRVQPLAGELSRYVVTSSDNTDEGEQDIIQTERIPGRIIHTIHNYGLFKFSTGNNSRPSTPTASIRSRAAIFGLDAISRNLFNARPGLSSDIFGSITSHKRAKSTISRSSVYTQSTGTDGSLSRFSRTSSIATAATSMMDDDSVVVSSKSSSTRRKLTKRGKSPSDSDYEQTPTRSRSHSRSQTASRESSRERDNPNSDEEDGNNLTPLSAPDLRRQDGLDDSELDLSMRLELARKNSENQHIRRKPVPVADEPFEETIFEETIYEDEPPPSLRPSSRMSRDSQSQRSTTPRPQSTTPTPESPPERNSRSNSLHSSDRRPMGPRSPSPMPSPPPHTSELPILPSMDLELALENTILSQMAPPPSTPIRPTEHVQSSLPRSRRQPFEPTGNTDVTPKAVLLPSGIPKPIHSVEPLSIKKRNSVRTSPGRKSYSRNSPLARSRIVSPKRIQPIRSQPATALSVDKAQSSASDELEKLIQLAESTKADVESSRRAIKRIKLEFDQFKPTLSKQADELLFGSPSPVKAMPRTPLRAGTPVTKEAQARMDEMRQLIGKRYVGDATPATPQRTMVDTPKRAPSRDGSQMDEFASSIEDYIFDADGDLAKAVSTQDTLQAEIRLLAASLKDKAIELERSRAELQNTKRQCELVKSLLADATAEKEIMYEAFNEELDGMYNDAQLPDDEAWTALTIDLRETKEARNELSRENSQLKRRISEAEQQKEEWGALLRAHGLIP